MEMTGERQIAASRDTVWAALNNPDVLKQCIPGCESLEMLSPTDMTARVKLQIGPVKANFSGKVKLSDLDPPNGYRISGEGNGGVAGYAKGGATVRLLQDGVGTLMRYDVKADVGGKLAQLGGRLIDATAKRLADEFFERFSEIVGGPSPAGQAAAGAPERKMGWFRRLLHRLFRRKKSN
ncbi:MAG TPA: carbon monoxide dehydrogenase subunit G [Hyphomicrobiaceae bacterium]|jgi:carbon monoxide dehydrogenase subunit G|nr:carbon monoxide dehydrogenase subunit G [Hyphomicrobiaceae bacterium]